MIFILSKVAEVNDIEEPETKPVASISPHTFKFAEAEFEPISTSSEKFNGSPTFAGGVIVTDVAPVPTIIVSVATKLAPPIAEFAQISP